MAEIGTIEQYQGPFDENQSLVLIGNCIIGISIGEDDYMKCGSSIDPQTGRIIEKSFRFKINGRQIWMGRTYIYQTEKQITESGVSRTVINFPDGAPSSVLVEVVYAAVLD